MHYGLLSCFCSHGNNILDDFRLRKDIGWFQNVCR